MRGRTRRRYVIIGAVAVTAGAMVTAGSGALAAPGPAAAGPAAPGPASAGPASASAASASAASDVTNLGTGGWFVQSSAVATQSGAQISTPGFGTSSWLPVSNDDAGAPGTEVEALAQNGLCPGNTSLQPVNQASSGTHSVFFSNNMQTCYGFMNTVGADTVPQFSVPWWWRADFTPSLASGQTGTLILNGVIGSANVWVNGTQVATSATVTGAFTRFTFNVTSLLRSGTNSVAIEVNPNNPNTMFTLDDVDWNQIPPDNNTGIQFPVQLSVDGALTDANARVTQSNAADLSSSVLTVKADITNNTTSAQTAVVAATITPPGGGTAITVTPKTVTVPAGSTQTVSLAPVTISAPQVWWPYQLGAQPLYTLATSVSQNSVTLDSTSGTFGIRNVTSFLTSGTSPGAPSGVRAFKINGVPIVIRGGGFSPNIFLHYSSADIGRQIALMKNMGLNTIRLEGHLMPADFYQQMDQAGILVNAGFQCCDAWELQSSGLTTSADFAIMGNSATAIAQSLRSHPSVFSFQWSDQPPTAQQESVTLTAFGQQDFQAPVISSAEYQTSPQLGVSGEKEGPYDWVPPNYWYDTTHFDTRDSSQTNAGGSWGYDSEQSAGDTIPTMDSLSRFMSASDLSNLWQMPMANQYHANYETACTNGYSFGTLCHLDAALSARYGTATSLAQYVQRAQALDYEDTRAQFEAFIDHSANTSVPSTGTIYWQMNKGFPSLLWNLYNSDGDQAGSYFGAQEANRPMHALYALDNGTVTLDNLSNIAQSGVSVESRVFSLSGSLLDDRTASNLSMTSQQVLTKVLTPKVPATGSSPVQVYFVELLLKQNGTVVDRNVYWLSTKQDATNWKRSLGNPVGTISAYANLQALAGLPQSAVSATAVTTHQAGPDGADLATTVTVTNTSSATVAFLLRSDVRRGTAAGTELPGDNELQSSTWGSNDVTLFPGETATLTVSYTSADLAGAVPVISLSGWNLPKTDITAPVP